MHVQSPRLVTTLASNCLPVSLLKTMETVFEKIVFKHAFYHLVKIKFSHLPNLDLYPEIQPLIELYFYSIKSAKPWMRASKFDLYIFFIFIYVKHFTDLEYGTSLLFELKKAGIGSKLPSWFSDYLSNRYTYQRVVLTGDVSDFGHTDAGVPQGSILGPLLFLAYVNDIVNDIESNINIFAHNTSLSMVVSHPGTVGRILQSDINKITNWVNRIWLVKFNPLKSESLLISRKCNRPIHSKLFI